MKTKISIENDKKDLKLDVSLDVTKEGIKANTGLEVSKESLKKLFKPIRKKYRKYKNKAKKWVS